MVDKVDVMCCLICLGSIVYLVQHPMLALIVLGLMGVVQFYWNYAMVAFGYVKSSWKLATTTSKDYAAVLLPAPQLKQAEAQLPQLTKSDVCFAELLDEVKDTEIDVYMDNPPEEESASIAEAILAYDPTNENRVETEGEDFVDENKEFEFEIAPNIDRLPVENIYYTICVSDMRCEEAATAVYVIRDEPAFEPVSEPVTERDWLTNYSTETEQPSQRQLELVTSQEEEEEDAEDPVMAAKAPFIDGKPVLNEEPKLVPQHVPEKQVEEPKEVKSVLKVTDEGKVEAKKKTEEQSEEEEEEESEGDVEEIGVSVIIDIKPESLNAEQEEPEQDIEEPIKLKYFAPLGQSEQADETRPPVIVTDVNEEETVEIDVELCAVPTVVDAGTSKVGLQLSPGRTRNEQPEIEQPVEIEQEIKPATEERGKVEPAEPKAEPGLVKSALVEIQRIVLNPFRKRIQVQTIPESPDEDEEAAEDQQIADKSMNKSIGDQSTTQPLTIDTSTQQMQFLTTGETSAFAKAMIKLSPKPKIMQHPKRQEAVIRPSRIVLAEVVLPPVNETEDRYELDPTTQVEPEMDTLSAPNVSQLAQQYEQQFGDRNGNKTGLLMKKPAHIVKQVEEHVYEGHEVNKKPEEPVYDSKGQEYEMAYDPAPQYTNNDPQENQYQIQFETQLAPENYNQSEYAAQVRYLSPQQNMYPDEVYQQKQQQFAYYPPEQGYQTGYCAPPPEAYHQENPWQTQTGQGYYNTGAYPDYQANPNTYEQNKEFDPEAAYADYIPDCHAQHVSANMSHSPVRRYL